MTRILSIRSFLKQAFTFASLALVFTACSSDDDDEPVRPQVMVVHASPNAPAVNISVNGQAAITNLAYPNNTSYTSLNVGNNTIGVAPAGSTTNVLTTNVSLEAGKVYSIFAIDSVAKIKVVGVEDNLATPAAGKAHVRFFHFSPNAPAVEVAVANGAVLFGNRSFNDQATNASLANFTPVDAGTYNLVVRPAGGSAVVLPLNGVTLTAGKIYTVYARGFLGGTGNQALGAGVIVNN
jgi:hypothetical protein